MPTLPPDILQEIDTAFATEQEREWVREKLQSLYHTALNVGPEQLARSILILATGSVKKLDELFATQFGGDPRDLIMAAMSRSRNSAQWGLSPFTQPIKQSVTIINQTPKAIKRLTAIAKSSRLPYEVVEYLYAFHWNMDGKVGTGVNERELLQDDAFHQRRSFLLNFFQVRQGAISRTKMIKLVHQKLQLTEPTALLKDFIAGALEKDYGRISQFATYWYLRNATAENLATLDGPPADFETSVLLYNFFLKLFRGGAVDRYRLDYVYADLVLPYPQFPAPENSTDWLHPFLKALSECEQKIPLRDLRNLLKKYLKGNKHFLQTVLEALAYAGYLKVEGHEITAIFLPDYRNSFVSFYSNMEWTYPLRFWQ